MHTEHQFCLISLQRKSVTGSLRFGSCQRRHIIYDSIFVTCRERNGNHHSRDRQYDPERKASGEEKTDDNDLSNDKDGFKVKSSFPCYLNLDNGVERGSLWVAIDS